jgi:hypothetical protein
MESEGTSSFETAQGGSPPLNARQIAAFLLPGIEIDEFLLWPPNLFALTSDILSASGAYTLVVSPPEGMRWPPTRDQLPHDLVRWYIDWRNSQEHEEASIAGLSFSRDAEHESWAGVVRALGYSYGVAVGLADYMSLQPNDQSAQEERRKLLAGIPPGLIALWRELLAGFSIGYSDNIRDLRSPGNWRFLVLLMSLHAVADEACYGWGTLNQTSPAMVLAKLRLIKFGSLATINPDRGRVLPKRHTPATGISLRSLSSNLAFHRSPITVSWREPGPTWNGRPPVLLLVPWPTRIATKDFREHDSATVSMAPGHGFFSFDPDRCLDPNDDHALPTGDNLDQLKRIISKAKEELGRVDMLVLPECSMPVWALAKLEQRLRQDLKVESYVAGAYGPCSKSNAGFGANSVALRALVEMGADAKNVEQDLQDKHHRWCIDPYQASQYQLGGVLPPTKYWWEAIRVPERRVGFLNATPDFTICTLICEDLARQEPIADLIRAVGPSLLIAILMDGPQLIRRWSSRYAAVLGEDPGTAVLTFTSIGMVNRWNAGGSGNSRVVALWKDARNGPAKEIELEPGSSAVALSLTLLAKREVTADGRVERDDNYGLALGGVHQVKCTEG